MNIGKSADHVGDRIREACLSPTGDNRPESEADMTRATAVRLLVCCAALALMVGVATATAGGSKSAGVKACSKGGWQALYRSDGSAFANQDQCVSYVGQGGRPRRRI